MSSLSGGSGSKNSRSGAITIVLKQQSQKQQQQQQQQRTMSSTTTTTTTTSTTAATPKFVRPPLSYKKQLEGVEATIELKELWKHALEMAKHTSGKQESGKAENSSSSSRNNVVQQATRRLTVAEAQKIFLECGVIREEVSKQNFVPISVIRAMEALLSHNNNDKGKSSAAQLEKALKTSKLVFTQPPVLTQQQEKERQRFLHRMDRLKLKDEERNYNKLTYNLKTSAAKAADDDITTRSMTYAASIGLNMIIAPLSFGCFMYFFAGGLFDFLGWTMTLPEGAGAVVDIKRVIIGVISGVIMLFIEMILFVIRTHEMDEAIRQKKAKQTRLGGVGAFGHYTAKTAREFKED